MDTVYSHVQIGVVDASGNVNIIYPKTYAKDVVVEQGDNDYLIDEGITSAQGFAESVGNDITSLKSRAGNIEEIIGYSNAESHNALYREKDITSLGITEICRRISSGTFDDLYIGDYFTTKISTSLGGEETVVNVLADFDTYLNSGEVNRTLEYHHAVIVPKYCFSTPAAMNSTSSTAGGYYESDMRNNVLGVYASALRNSLADHLISHRSFITTDVNSSAKSAGYSGFTGASSSCEWYDETLELLSEQSVCGSPIWGNARDTGLQKTQLAYFKHSPADILTGLGTVGSESWWLRSVAKSNYFACVNKFGNIHNALSSELLGVRPMYLIS